MHLAEFLGEVTLLQYFKKLDACKIFTFSCVLLVAEWYFVQPGCDYRPLITFRYPRTAHGPERTLTKVNDAAVRRHRTGHSCIAQHFEIASDGKVDKAPIYCSCAIGCFS
ncbi:hypothetical protein AN189_12540 [Loktanella sp. 3ANDIMAR09]|nr:hypothetical protein AN189_12540 [Loktanella sp. 3ANDIMAR09]